jgi:hypothetical protein
MTTLEDAGNLLELESLAFTNWLATGQIRPYPSKKAAAQLSQFSLQQPMTDLVKCLGEISIYCVHQYAIFLAVQYIRSKLNQIGHS